MQLAVPVRRFISYVAVFVIFIAILVTSYQFKVSSDKRNITDSNALSTVVNEDPKYNQLMYKPQTISDDLDEKSLIDYGNDQYKNSEQPQLIQLTNVTNIQLDSIDQLGQLDEVDYYVSNKKKVLWYKITYPLQATFKEKMSDVFDMSVDTQVNLHDKIAYTKVQVMPNKKPEEFISYLPSLYENIVDNINSDQKVEVQIELKTSWGEYVYNRVNQNQLIRVKYVENED
ncbi:MAG: hypothetical protein PWP69_1096 [Enterococcus sp.]|uniref:hypothetical protein n=1 Tax=Enterococcus sp. TaxID=35783 RepID=UPI00258A401B|nr:hypothetical protein [Enterococcus sp.]MDK2844304.1 hypothetical protein [Enterococcus sp.]